MKQLSMTTGFEKYTKATKRQAFLSDMDRLLPWAELCALIAPHYPQDGNGRPPKEMEMMLRETIGDRPRFPRWVRRGWIETVVCPRFRMRY